MSSYYYSDHSIIYPPYPPVCPTAKSFDEYMETIRVQCTTIPQFQSKLKELLDLANDRFVRYGIFLNITNWIRNIIYQEKNCILLLNSKNDLTYNLPAELVQYIIKLVPPYRDKYIPIRKIRRLDRIYLIHDYKLVI